eukprot:CAMPEP_0194367516 /NCGR_PEP_ID=MMETSP0174-20130528/15607_1 /TAXON_ID=216777 /ORGANISM="Proboscia alata, Strain PI-D3" /LENGTH=250 /DNA_ID=CAMNT_0039143311 /DNA_START=247 /DNA_END=999 /DNA_ORIENTATION=+
MPYQTHGKLLYASPDRYLVTTHSPDTTTTSTDDTSPTTPETTTTTATHVASSPLPQGLCGGPVLDANNRVAGVVEGIVPLNHADESLRGCAAFIPASTLRSFLEGAEQYMLEQILPPRLFAKVEKLRRGESLNEKTIEVGVKNAKEEEQALQSNPDAHANPDEEYDFLVKKMKQTYSAKEVEAVMATVEREREEVMALIREGTGEVDIGEAIRNARERTRRTQQELMQEIEIQQAGQTSSTEVNATTVPK